jgi:peptidoglycan hydrolase-like protein with peptidoglycan-binding domain
MQKLLVALVVGLLWLWPIVPEGGESGRAGEQPVEQRQGPTKEQIQQVQGRLKAIGLDPGPVDGTLGPQTETALRTYQQRQGLPVSGQPDETTIQTLLAAGGATGTQRPQVLPDPVQEAQTPRPVPATRPEQQRSEHDRSGRFQATNAQPSSPAFADQPDQGKVLGFDFFRDPLNAKRPMQTFEETMKADIDAKPGVMAAQQQLLERRYDLTPRLDPDHRMSRGKPIAVGPTARLGSGQSWESLAKMTPEAIRQRTFSPTRLSPTRSKPRAVRSFRKCRS